MRKTYLLLLALMFTVMGTTVASAQKIYRAELDKSMFKAWTSNEPGATVVENPAAIDVTDANPNGTPFSCDNNLFKELGDWSGIFGNTSAYYLWYADLTGTQTMYFTGTPGLKFWVQFNRQAPVEGGDSHGGDMVQQELTIAEDGTVSYDCSAMEYVHLNCIKTKSAGVKGLIKSMEIVGTVKPVTGVLSVINNGDAEGTDLKSFPVSFDGPRNGGTANERPEVVDGGVSGKCFKVTSHTDPTESWHTQFYIKADEVMAKGSKWKLTMAIKGDQAARITTSAQAAPRTWKGGMGIDEFGITTEWKTYTWSGEIGVDDFQSIAFDLSNGDEEVSNTDGTGTVKVNRGYTFYFDNIEFGYDLGGTNPLNDIAITAGGEAVCVNFGGNTNMKELVKAASTKTLIYDNSAASVTIDGQPVDIVSVEGFDDGNLLIFIDDAIYGEEEVKVAFKNPEDAAYQLLFKEGKWAGQAVPEFSGLVATYAQELYDGQYVSYLYGEPAIVEIAPEAGSFNLPADFKEITVTFNQKVKVSSIVAKLGKEALTATGEEELTKIVKLTRTSTAALNGANNLVISEAEGAFGATYALKEPITVKYSFGPVSSDAQPEVVYEANFTTSGDNANGAGWIVNADGGGMQAANSSGGCRLQHDKSGFSADVLYLAQRGTSTGGVALYGTEEGYALNLEPKTYHLTLNVAQWDAYDNARALRVQVLPLAAVNAADGSLVEGATVLAEDFKEIEPEFNNSKDATKFDVEFTVQEAGNYVIRMVPSKPDGSFNGYSDGCAIGDVKVEFIPDVLGVVETKNLNDAFEAAKAKYEELVASEENRYVGVELTALKNLIDEVEANKANYSAPSVYVAKTEELTAKTKTANDYKTLCDDYDKLPQQAFDLYVQKKNGKFKDTEYVANLKAVVEKYCTMTTEETVNEETGETTIVDVLQSFKLFYTEAELTAAKNELSEIITMTSKMLSEGASHNWYGGGDRTYGFAALHERLRRGVELLKSLGVTEDAPEIQYAESVLGDSDDAADAIMKRASTAIFTSLSSAESTLFDDVNAYDLSVFVKNPNIYSPANSTDLPGWTSVRGNCFVFPGWGAEHTADTPYAEDCQIHAGWHPSALPMVEQTITNLPAGVYTITIDGSNNGGETPNTYGYVKVSNTPAFEDGDELDPDLHFAGYVDRSGDIEGITVVDGVLTIGYCYGPESQAFLNEVSVKLTSPVADHDYGKDLTDGIDSPADVKVRALQVYDLNGRRMIKAQKGLQIVKKQMSDGTVRVEKVIVK